MILKEFVISKRWFFNSLKIKSSNNFVLFKKRFEESIANHEKEVKELNAFLVDVRQQKELCIREINELKTQLKMVEDMRDNIRRELLDSNRRTRELEEELELHRKEINELKRYLNDEVREKELVINSNEDLRNKLKACENDKTDLNRLVDECKQRILGSLRLFVNL